jgi:hypothetical protein
MKNSLDCGFSGPLAAHRLTGEGPKIAVDIGFDPTWRAGETPRPPAAAYRGISALIDTGAIFLCARIVRRAGSVGQDRFVQIGRSLYKLAMARSGRPRSTGSRLPLDEPLRTDFDDFLKAHHMASSKEVIQKALRAFIEADLAKNAGVREEYEALRRARRQRNGTIPRLVKPEREC